MTSGTPSSDGPKGVARDHKAEIVDRLYDVALDPIRLEELMQVWEGRIGILRQGHVKDVVPLDDPEIEAHLDRASIFLYRFVASREDGAYRSVLEDIPRSAAFLSDGGPILTGFNRPAAVAFGLRDGAALVDLPFEADDLDMLRDVIRKVASGRAERGVALRIRSSITGSPVIVRVGPVEGETAKPLALVMSTELVWPEGFEITVQEAFGLTAAEVEIVRGITLGLPVKDIAEARGRSAETVRTQLRSILAKTETHSQSELVRVVLGLMDVALMPSEGTPASARKGNLEPLVYQYVKAQDGRRLEFIEFGNPAGRRCRKGGPSAQSAGNRAGAGGLWAQRSAPQGGGSFAGGDGGLSGDSGLAWNPPCGGAGLGGGFALCAGGGCGASGSGRWHSWLCRATAFADGGAV